MYHIYLSRVMLLDNNIGVDGYYRGYSGGGDEY